LLVGGTMLYFKALFDGLDALPRPTPRCVPTSTRARRAGWPALHAELAAIDPATAARLAPNDSQRIQRALEVHRVSGRPLSAWHSPPTALTPPLIALEPNDRAWLHARIGERFAAMLDAGFVDEVRRLRERARPAPRPAVDARRRLSPRLGRHSKATTSAHARSERDAPRPRQLAKRQLTWLRSMPWRQVVACDASRRNRPGRRPRPSPRRGRPGLADPVLDIAGLVKRYGASRSSKASTSSSGAGEFVAVVGESGVGKSTLLNCAAGLDTSTPAGCASPAPTSMRSANRRRRCSGAITSASCSRRSTSCRT
jgi:hypothetical protein